VAYVTPTTRADGYVVDATEYNKNTVDNVIALRTGGIAIASQAANDLVYASSATQFARLAAGTAGQVLQTNGVGSAPSWVTASTPLGLVNGRLSLTTAVPVTTADVTAAATLYFALYGGNRIALYTGTLWQMFTIAELSIAVPGTTNQMYDVFVDYNAGTPQLALTAWTNDTTRATALTLQDGVLVKTGSTGQRYVGSFRTTGVSGQTEDSFAKRFVWNYYNRAPRQMRVLESTDNWDYTTAVWRQARGQAANQLAFIIGVADTPLTASVFGISKNDTGGSSFAVAIGLDSTTAPTTGNIGMYGVSLSANVLQTAQASLTVYPAVGYHYAAWLEYAITTTNIQTWYGDNGAATLYQTGISGTVLG
jgi:hypothetical protein